MKIEYRGPLMEFKEISANPDYSIIVNTRKIVEKDGCLTISTSEREDVEHWVSLDVDRKNGAGTATIDIRCASYDEALKTAQAICEHREKAMTSSNKPWHKPVKAKE